MGFRVYFSETDYYDSDGPSIFISPGPSFLLSGSSKKIFEYLVENAECSKTHEEIYRAYTGTLPLTDCNKSVTEAIKTLRKKLGIYKGCIETVREVGYRYKGSKKTNKSELATDKTNHQQNNNEAQTSAPSESEPPVTEHSNKQAQHATKTPAPPKQETPTAEPTDKSVQNAQKTPGLSRKKPPFVEIAENSLKRALNKFLEAVDNDEINHVKNRIKDSIREYARNVCTSYSNNYDEAGNEEERLEEHQGQITHLISECLDILYRLNQDTDLVLQKEYFLYFIASFHFAVEFLRAQYNMVKSRLDNAGINNKQSQEYLNKLVKDYKDACKKAEDGEKDLNEQLNEKLNELNDKQNSRSM